MHDTFIATASARQSNGLPAELRAQLVAALVELLMADLDACPLPAPAASELPLIHRITDMD